jgi:transcriptional regulator with GAF, ATPase, and Fis domain
MLRLVGTTGPLAGTALTLADGLTVGNPVGPETSGNGATASERPPHWFRVEATSDGQFTLQALDPDTLLFVNGLPLTTRPLALHDEVRVGDSLFVVQADEPPAVIGFSAAPVRHESLTGASHLLNVTFDEMLLHTGETETTRHGNDLLTLMRASAVLSSIKGLAAFDAALAGFVCDVVPADRVVLAGGDGGPAEVRTAWGPRAMSVSPVTVDTDLLKQVTQDGVAKLVRHGELDVVVAPMLAYGRATGAIWAELREGETVDAGHLRLLLVVAALVAVARDRAIEATRLQDDNDLLHAEINIEHNMVGRSGPMRTLFDRVARVAKSESTVLLRGENGAGKELVARAVHRNSSRADRPFITINCAAITESLLESELFGHEKGAFTGAVGLKKGKLELADRGTLFLDEIGELSLSLQPKLLRALQEREFERVGGTRPIKVDFRLIAATNRDLEAAVKAGTFRQDLFYRLNVVTLFLPPLRDRKDDLPLLADYFVKKHAPRCGRRVRGIAAGALDRLIRHEWPGNVRELENVVEQALALGSGEHIEVSDLPFGLGDDPELPANKSLRYHDAVEETKRELILRALERAGRSHAAAARLLGVHPNYLHRLMRNFNLRESSRD